jgi:hypothetical protein
MTDSGSRREIKGIGSQQLGYGPSLCSIHGAQSNFTLGMPLEEQTCSPAGIRERPLIKHSVIIEAEAVSVTYAAQHNVDCEVRWLGSAGGVE